MTITLRAPARRYLTLLIAFLIGVSLTFLMFELTRASDRVRAEHAFRGISTDRMHAIEEQLQDETLKLRYLKALFGSSSEAQVGNYPAFVREFRALVRDAVIGDPGIETVAFIQRVGSADRDKFVRTLRLGGLPGYEIRDLANGMDPAVAPVRALYAPIVAAEPLSRMEELQGIDLWNIPSLQTALQTATGSNAVAASEAVDAPIPTDSVPSGQSPGVFWMFEPLVSQTAPNDALSGAAPMHEGYMGMAFRVGPIVESAISNLSPAGIDLSLYDSRKDKPRTLLYLHSSRTRHPASPTAIVPEDEPVPYTWTETFTVGQRTWQIIARPAPAFLTNHRYSISWTVLAVGTLSTLLFTLFLYLNTRQTDRTELAIRDRTEELSHEVAQHRRTAESLQKAHAELSVQMDTVNRRRREIEALSDLGDVLQTCQDVDEAYSIISEYASNLFPGSSGELFMFQGSQKYLENVSAWGEHASSEPLIEQDSCWGLRRGKAHIVSSGLPGMRCEHVGRMPSALTRSLCLPLTAQGEILGLIHLLDDDAANTDSEQWTKLATATAEHAALALANIKLRETLRQQSIRDPLTGLYNRRFMEDTLEREVRRATRSSATVGVAIFDIDHFKNFNDTFGHEAGDAVLRALGNLLRASVRGEDVPCRFGGEEFVLILPGADLDASARKAESIRIAVASLRVEHGGKPLPKMSVSGGVASLPAHASSGQELLQGADSALYRAKAAGRNRIEIAHTKGATEEDPGQTTIGA